MTAAVYNIVIEPGATFTLNFTYKANGSPVNLTGWKAGLQVADQYGDAVIDALTCTTENGLITLGGSAGTVSVRIPKENTALVTIPSGVYDLLLVAPDGTGVRLLEGKVKVNPQVTVQV